MIVQIDRIVKKGLTDFVNLLLDTDDEYADELWNEILGLDETGGYTETEIAEIRAAFTKNKPTVGLSWARATGPFPYWSIIMSEAPTDVELLGKLGEVGEYSSESGTMLSTSLSLTENQGLTIAIYVKDSPEHLAIHSALVKAGMLWMQSTILATGGVSGYWIYSTSDPQPAPEYLPMALFLRTQSWGFAVASSIMVKTTSKKFEPPIYLGMDGEDLGDNVEGSVSFIPEEGQ